MLPCVAAAGAAWQHATFAPRPLSSRSLVTRASTPRCVGPPQWWAGAAGVAVLGSVIVVHEAGHFAAARVQKMRVSEFSVGFGPAILQGKRPGGTVSYVLRLLPIGGFVSFPRYLNETRYTERGLTPPQPTEVDVTDPDDPDLIENRPALQQALVISAGVLANLVLAWSCLFTSATTVGVPSLNLASPLAVSRVLEGSTAQAAGLQARRPVLHLARQPGSAAPDPRLTRAGRYVHVCGGGGTAGRRAALARREEAARAARPAARRDARHRLRHRGPASLHRHRASHAPSP